MNAICYVAVTLLIVAASAAAAPRPNVLLVMADDLGFSDLGCYGGEIATPNLDRVAAEGLRFTRFYNTARCWPTRAALLTGYYAQQVRRDWLPGVPSGGGNRAVRPGWAPLLPALLKPAGYRSYHTGKWHIDGMPVAQGFDRSYFLQDQSRFFNPTAHWLDDEPLPPVEPGSGFYGTTAVADRAIEVLEEHAAEHAGRPFFHYIAFAAPHFPLHALPEDIALYQDTYRGGWEAVRAARWGRQREIGLFADGSVAAPSVPESALGPPYHFPEAFDVLGSGEVGRPVPWGSLSAEQQGFQSTKMAIHAAMVHRMDAELGRVFDQVKAMGEWENTLVMFLSDNGASAEIMVRADGHDPAAAPGSAETYLCLGPGWSTVANTPFRRHKTWTHEGGIATPLIVSWPAGIGATGRGTLRHSAGHVIDVVPTLLELAGAAPPEGAPEAPGQSLVSAFGSGGGSPGRRLWWFHDGHRAALDGRWKAVSPAGEPWELYDLGRDRGESLDLAVPQAGVLAGLASWWDAQLGAFVDVASRDLAPGVLDRAKSNPRQSQVMSEAQAAAKAARPQVLHGEAQSFLLAGRHAFVMEPAKNDGEDGDGNEGEDAPRPWVFYAPTLARYPDEAESWMHRRLLAAGVAVAGIDVGEAYGSPHAFPFFQALYDEMARRGFSGKPALLGRSRGGLWAGSWAIANPDRVAGIAGIYPVFDFTTYPGAARAAPAYGLDVDGLLEQENQLNPVRRGGVLAEAGVPVFIIHGTGDAVVPAGPNSRALRDAYERAGAAGAFQLVEADGQGHTLWPGFFQCRELVDFLVERARAGAGGDGPDTAAGPR